MEVLKAIAAFLGEHMTKILGTAQTVIAAILGAAAAKQIPDLVAVDSPAFQWLVLANLLLGGATIARGFNNGAQIKVATAIDNALQATPAPKQTGFASIGMRLTVLMLALAMTALAGCATDPATGEQRLTNTGKAAIAAFAGELADRMVAESPDKARTIANIREVATRLQAVTDAVTVSELRQRVDAEVAQLNIGEVNLRSWQRWAPIFEGLLTDWVGSDRLDANGYVRVNEFLQMILLALPPS